MIWRAHWTPASASDCAWTWSRRLPTSANQRCCSVASATATVAASAATSIARISAAPPARSRVRGAPCSSQREPAVDPRAVGERQREAHGARQRRPRPAAASSRASCRRASGTRVRNAATSVDQRIDRPAAPIRRMIELRPVREFDRAVAQPVADPLSRGSGLDRELGTGAREHERALAAGRGGHPRGLAAARRRARRAAPPAGCRTRSA